MNNSKILLDRRIQIEDVKVSRRRTRLARRARGSKIVSSIRTFRQKFQVRSMRNGILDILDHRNPPPLAPNAQFNTSRLHIVI